MYNEAYGECAPERSITFMEEQADSWRRHTPGKGTSESLAGSTPVFSANLNETNNMTPFPGQLLKLPERGSSRPGGWVASKMGSGDFISWTTEPLYQNDHLLCIEPLALSLHNTEKKQAIRLWRFEIMASMNSSNVGRQLENERKAAEELRETGGIKGHVFLTPKGRRCWLSQYDVEEIWKL